MFLQGHESDDASGHRKRVLNPPFTALISSVLWGLPRAVKKHKSWYAPAVTLLHGGFSSAHIRLVRTYLLEASRVIWVSTATQFFFFYHSKRFANFDVSECQDVGIRLKRKHHAYTIQGPMSNRDTSVAKNEPTERLF